MADDTGDPTVKVKVGGEADEASFNALADKIEGVLSKNLTDFQHVIGDILKSIGRNAENNLGGASKGFKKAEHAARDYGTALRHTDKQMLDVVRHLKMQTDAIEVQSAALKVLAQDINKERSASNRASEERQRLEITGRIESDRIRQAEMHAVRDANQQMRVETNNAGQLNLIRTREHGKQRIQIVRAVLETIARMEKATGAVVAGIARTTTSAISKVWSTIGGIVRRGTSNITNIHRSADLNINQSIRQSLSVRETNIRNSYSRQERIIGQSVQRQQRQLTAIRSSLSGGLLGAATGRGAGGGVGLGGIAAGGGLVGLLTAGFERFSDLERLNKQFLALTGNIETTNELMAQVKEFAKLTPFDLVGVADLAKGFLAIGTAADKVMPQVKAIADAVALTGGGVDALNRIQRAIGQVVSAGRLQGDELNQLAENLPGLNIRKLLANQLTGGDTRALVDMQAAGEISADMFVKGLIDGLSTDPRLVGASEDLAKTLGGRVANLKESFADLGASIIGLFSNQIKGAVLGLQTVFQGLADFIKGEGLSASLETLRVALGGVAVGLSAVAAAKGSLEVFAVLGRTLGLILTPLGLVATASGLLGGAIALMMAQSIPFRIAVKKLGEEFGEVAGQIKDLVVAGLTRLADFVSTTVIPRLTDLANWLGAHLQGAFRVTADFIKNTVIPVLGRVAGIIGRGLVTAYRAASDFIKSTVVPALQSFVGVLREDVFPVVADVARAIGHGFMEGLRAVQRFGQRIRPYIQPAIDGFKGLWHAIQNALGGDFSSIGSGAMGALGGIGRSIVNLWDLAFEALRPLARKALDIVKSIFTVDNLIKAGKAVLDFVEWIGKTLGTIVTHPAFIAAVAGIAAAAVLVGLRFLEGFVRGILSNVPRLFGIIKDAFADNFEIVLGVLVGGVALATLVRGFRRMGGAAGTGFLAGMRATIGGSVGMMQGLFSGGAGPLLARRTGQDMKAVTREASMMQSKMLAFGVQRLYDPSTSGLGAMRRDMQKVNLQLNEGQRMGLLMREAFQNMGTVVKMVFTSPSGILGAFKNLWESLRQRATEGGRTVGAEIARGIGSGLAVGFASFTTGKFMGEAGQSPLMSILTGAFTGFAISGGNPIAAGIGAIAGGIGQAFGEAAREAKELRQRAEELADIIKTDLGDAFKQGTVWAVDFSRALAGDQGGGLGHAILEQLDPVFLDALLKGGVRFTDIIEAFRDGEAGLDRLKEQLTDNLDWKDAGVAIAGLAEVFGVLETALADVNREAEFTRKFLFPNRAAFEQAQAAVAQVTPGTGMFGGSVLARRIGDFMGADRMEGGPTRRPVGDSTPIFGAGSNAATAVARRAFRDAADDTNEFYLNLRRANQEWDSLGAKPKPKTLEQLQADADKVVETLASVNTELDKAFRPRGSTDLQAATNSAILAVKDSFDEIKIGGDIFDQAALEQALTEFTGQIGEVVKIGVADDIAKGIIPTEAGLQAMTDPILQALLATTDDPALKGLIFSVWKDSIQRGAAAAWAAQGGGFDEAGLPTDTIANNAKTGMKIVGRAIDEGMAEGVRENKHLVVAAVNEVAGAAEETAIRRLGISSPSKVFMDIGRFIGEGLEIGINESVSGIDAIMASAVDSAISAATEAAKGGTATLRTAGAALFGSLVGSDAPLGGGPALGIATGWTSALAGFKSALSSTVQQAFDVALKKFEGTAMSPSELDIFGESAFSLIASDVLGAENIDSMRAVIDNIVDFGSTLLEVGVPAEDVVARLKSMRDEFLFTAGALGFNVDEVRSLVDALGLSDVALENFVVSLGSVTAAAANAAAGASTEALSAEAKRIRSLAVEAVTLSPADLAVFMRENGLGEDFWLDLGGFRADIMADPSRDALEDLGRGLGFWGSALESFVETIEQWVLATNPNFTTEGGDPEQIGTPGSGITHLTRPDINVNIYPPYGDPLAIGLSAVNAVAAQAQVPGG